jgi:type I restriction enzyme S subunit
MTLRVHPDEIVAESNSPLLACHDSWERVRLGDIVEIRNGAAFKSSFFNTDGDGLPLIRIRNVGKPESDTWYSGEYDDDYLVQPGDILIGMDGDFRVARWTGPTSLLNQRVCRLSVLSPEYLNETFLLHLLQGYLDEVNKLTSSVTVKHLSSKTVQDLPIPLPPLHEQQRIVESVEAAFSRVDALEATIQGILERVGVFRRSVLAEAFAGRLVPQDPSDEPASVLLDRIRVDRETAKKDLERMKA